MVEEESVNAADAQSWGEKILTSMVGHSVAEYKFSPNNQVQTLASSVHVKTFYWRTNRDGSSAFIPASSCCRYQQYPWARSHEIWDVLFSNISVRQSYADGDNAELIHNLLKLVPECVVSTTLDTGFQFIADGGALLHKLLWPKHFSYADICAMYVRHVRSIYECVFAVCDGYYGPTTKEEFHHRRTGSDIGASVLVSTEMRLSMSKKAFLANTSHKQAIMNFLV